MSLPTDLVKRLTYSKYLFERAVGLQGNASDVSSAQAVLTLHDAAEMLMRVVTDHLGIAPSFSFMDFWSRVTEKGHPTPPHKGALDRLNQLRVGFKHKGNLPNPKVVADLLPQVGDFCVETVQKCLSLDFDTISLADLIPNEEAKSRVKEAEQAFADGDIPTAVLSLGSAFDALYSQAQKQSQDALIEKDMTVRFYSEARNASLDKELGVRDLRRQLNAVTDTLNILLLGIEPKNLRRFSTLTPNRWETADRKLHYGWRRSPSELDAESYRFCLGFVIDFGLRMS